MAFAFKLTGIKRFIVASWTWTMIMHRIHNYFPHFGAYKCIYVEWCLCTALFSPPFTFRLCYVFECVEKFSDLSPYSLEAEIKSLWHKLKIVCQTITQVSEILCLFNYCQWPMGLHIKWKHRSIYSVYGWTYAQRTYCAMNGILIAANETTTTTMKFVKTNCLGTTNCQWFLTEKTKYCYFHLKWSEHNVMMSMIPYVLGLVDCKSKFVISTEMPIYMLNWFHIFRTLAFSLID